MLKRKFAILPVLLAYLIPSPVYAQRDWGGKCVVQNDVATIEGLECLFFNILQVVVVIAGLAFVVMFLNGAFQYLFSSNDQKKVASAAGSLTMSVLGLVGIIISWLILRFIGDFTGINVTDFLIPDWR